MSVADLTTREKEKLNAAEAELYWSVRKYCPADPTDSARTLIVKSGTGRRILSFYDAAKPILDRLYRLPAAGRLIRLGVSVAKRAARRILLLR